ncbi:MAG: serine--tRNA ligase [Arenicella sp.]|jgi:seryl-tRNA synthetase|nr:serine--tRNA ligase [Arenicella sp.]
MIDPNILRAQAQGVAQQLKKKNFDFDAPAYLALEERRKTLQVASEDLQAARNAKSKEIGKLKAQGQDTSVIMAEVASFSDQMKAAQADLESVQASLRGVTLGLPNVPHVSVPEGNSEDDNLEILRWGEPRKFDFDVEDHVDLGEALGMLDFEVATKIAGSRFVVIKSALARLQRAITQYMIDTHIDRHGYTEVYVPYLVNADSLLGTGQLPKFEDDQFKTQAEDGLYLIPTAEVPVTNIVRDVILSESQVPLKMAAHTPCFRREAGSYGRDTRGMIRQHQFEKVELVQVVEPQDSYAALEELTGHAEAILKDFELPYRKVNLCGGDLGFSAAKTYDLEVWLPGQQAYREISSCSNFEDFQARRMLARMRVGNAKPQLVHTVNGSGLAVGRTLLAIMENYQQSDGRIAIPEVLRSYTNGMNFIDKLQ